jgi:hypothetical protein
MIRKLPKDRSTRRKRAFAWLPMITTDGYKLWFEYYTRVEQYWSYKNMWVLKERLSRGSKIMTNDGDKSWFLNGKLHREDGPAVEWNDGTKFWYLNDKRLTEEEFNKRMAPTVEMTMAQISEALGKNVKVVK